MNVPERSSDQAPEARTKRQSLVAPSSTALSQVRESPGARPVQRSASDPAT